MSSYTTKQKDFFHKALDKVFSSHSDIKDCFRANLSRFASYKAYRLNQTLEHIKQTYSKQSDIDKVSAAAINTFARYSQTEYNTIIKRSSTAKQFSRFFDPDRLKHLPNLKWLPSVSVEPRETHIPFYNRVWAKTDAFWQDNFPGSLWNCKCSLRETSEPITDGNPTPTTPIAHPGLDGNPYFTKQIFSASAPYFRRPNENQKQRQQIEKQCELLNTKTITHEVKQQLKDKTAQVTINNKTYKVEFHSRGIEHCLGDMLGKQDIFWLKNIILSNIDKYIKSAVCIGKKTSDTSHNTNAKTKRLKEHTDYFYYFRTTLPNGKIIYIHLSIYKKEYIDNNEMYLYSITSNLPKNTESV